MAKAVGLALAALTGTQAEIQPDAICMSLCGLLADTTKDCKLTTASGAVCERLFYDASNNLVYEAGIIPGQRPVTVAEALVQVRAKDDNCYAMCYNDSKCRGVGSHCSDNGVCKNLFWNQYDKRDVSKYMLLTQDNESKVNLISPVMCDPKLGKEPEVLDYPGVIDICQAVCSLSHTVDECSRVYRVGYECYRMFWADSQKQATIFTVDRINHGEYPAITVQEAFDLLLAKDNSCENLCRMHPVCKLAPEMSHCNEVNRSCRGLFYYSGAVAKGGMQVCFGPTCSEASPVTCRMPNDSNNFLVKPAMKNAKGGVAGDAGTTTKSYEVATTSMVTGSLIVAFLLL